MYSGLFSCKLLHPTRERNTSRFFFRAWVGGATCLTSVSSGLAIYNRRPTRVRHGPPQQSWGATGSPWRVASSYRGPCLPVLWRRPQRLRVYSATWAVSPGIATRYIYVYCTQIIFCLSASQLCMKEMIGTGTIGVWGHKGGFRAPRPPTYLLRTWLSRLLESHRRRMHRVGREGGTGAFSWL